MTDGRGKARGAPFSKTVCFTAGFIGLGAFDALGFICHPPFVICHFFSCHSIVETPVTG
jgi:hypothetical protein